MLKHPIMKYSSQGKQQILYIFSGSLEQSLDIQLSQAGIS